ncbi:hypothetical protein [Candidatus Proelusimicrobium volucris]|uniref:hypothetical protein n=1 Tax=Candidatus Proelusimicrobium volucris TaxID=3416225 RepID=UPI003D0EA966
MSNSITYNIISAFEKADIRKSICGGYSFILFGIYSFNNYITSIMRLFSKGLYYTMLMSRLGYKLSLRKNMMQILTR